MKAGGVKAVDRNVLIERLIQGMNPIYNADKRAVRRLLGRQDDGLLEALSDEPGGMHNIVQISRELRWLAKFGPKWRHHAPHMHPARSALPAFGREYADAYWKKISALWNENGTRKPLTEGHSTLVVPIPQCESVIFEARLDDIYETLRNGYGGIEVFKIYYKLLGILADPATAERGAEFFYPGDGKRNCIVSGIELWFPARFSTVWEALTDIFMERGRNVSRGTSGGARHRDARSDHRLEERNGVARAPHRGLGVSRFARTARATLRRCVGVR